MNQRITSKSKSHKQRYHFDGLVSEVGIGHRRALVFGLDAPLGQQLQQGAVVFGLRGLGLVAVQQQAVGAAVQLRGLQQAADGRLEVLLLILVAVEGVSQLGGDVLCQNKEDTRARWVIYSYRGCFVS